MRRGASFKGMHRSCEGLGVGVLQGHGQTFFKVEVDLVACTLHSKKLGGWCFCWRTYPTLLVCYCNRLESIYRLEMATFLRTFCDDDIAPPPFSLVVVLQSFVVPSAAICTVLL